MDLEPYLWQRMAYSSKSLPSQFQVTYEVLEDFRFIVWMELDPKLHWNFGMKYNFSENSFSNDFEKVVANYVFSKANKHIILQH